MSILSMTFSSSLAPSLLGTDKTSVLNNILLVLAGACRRRNAIGMEVLG